MQSLVMRNLMQIVSLDPQSIRLCALFGIAWVTVTGRDRQEASTRHLKRVDDNHRSLTSASERFDDRRIIHDA
jgi:hypothetical protein